VEASTRGTGTEGDDITAAARLIENIPYPPGFAGEARGEAIQPAAFSADIDFKRHVAAHPCAHQIMRLHGRRG
jgi:NAD-dependent DNA ligase